MREAVPERLAEVVRVERRRVLATLVRTLGSLDLAEDAVQEAALAALQHWPQTGIPAEPRAWLTVTARRKALDVLRREARRSDKETAAMTALDGQDPGPTPEEVVEDDLLRLIFTCAHPSLGREAQVALSLRTLCGLSTSEVAAALLVEEATMAKRLTRVRQKIARAGIPYRVPSAAELPQRLPVVLCVVYLIFTEGHRSTGGPSLVRADLCDEAVRLARLVAELMPGEPEVLSLLALLMLTDARRLARTSEDGDLVLLADQDRSRWDRARIQEGVGLLREAVRRSGGAPGCYQLQAHLAACHSTARCYGETDWATIVGLYDLLVLVSPGPVTVLNRAVAVLEHAGPGAGLSALDDVPDAARGHLWHAARSECLTRLGRRDEALAACDTALAGRPAPPERRLLEGRRQQLTR